MTKKIYTEIIEKNLPTCDGEFFLNKNGRHTFKPWKYRVNKHYEISIEGYSNFRDFSWSNWKNGIRKGNIIPLSNHITGVPVCLKRVYDIEKSQDIIVLVYNDRVVPHGVCVRNGSTVSRASGRADKKTRIKKEISLKDSLDILANLK